MLRHENSYRYHYICVFIYINRSSVWLLSPIFVFIIHEHGHVESSLIFSISPYSLIFSTFCCKILASSDESREMHMSISTSLKMMSRQNRSNRCVYECEISIWDERILEWSRFHFQSTAVMASRFARLEFLEYSCRNYVSFMPHTSCGDMRVGKFQIIIC